MIVDKSTKSCWQLLLVEEVFVRGGARDDWWCSLRVVDITLSILTTMARRAWEPYFSNILEHLQLGLAYVLEHVTATLTLSRHG